MILIKWRQLFNVLNIRCSGGLDVAFFFFLFIVIVFVAYFELDLPDLGWSG